jgi:hypothetical protein
MLCKDGNNFGTLPREEAKTWASREKYSYFMLCKDGNDFGTLPQEVAKTWHWEKIFLF